MASVDLEQNMLSHTMDRRRFAGKAATAVGSAIVALSLGSAFAEGRQVHLTEDYQGVSPFVADQMHEDDHTHWLWTGVKAAFSPIGVFVLARGIFEYQKSLPSTAENEPTPSLENG